MLGRYTWSLYASRLLSLARIYSFWKYVSDLDRTDCEKYLELMYLLVLRPLLQKASWA